jgi:hypothetical protein
MTLIQFNTAKLAREKGFKFQNAASENDYQGENPTQSELQKWLRDVHGIDIIIDLSLTNLYNKNERNYFVDIYCTNLKTHPKIDEYIQSKGIGVPEGGGSHKLFISHEEALEDGLFESLKLIENDNN